MPNKFAHFAIEAGDVARARDFYQAVFGWSFEPWGPPNFYLINGAGVHGALQERREPAPEGRKGFECSFAVDDVKASVALIKKAGGVISGPEVSIPTVGTLVSFEDTEGNAAIIIQYTPERRAELNL